MVDISNNHINHIFSSIIEETACLLQKNNTIESNYFYFDDAFKAVCKHYDSWLFGTLSSFLYKISALPEYKALQEKYKDRLKNPNNP